LENKTKIKKGSKEVLVCDLSLVYIGDDEFSFEEIRAMRSGYLLDDDDTPEAPPVRQPFSVKILKPVVKERRTIGNLPIEPMKAQVNSPTINTRAAQEDVFSMFNQETEVRVEEDQTISAKVLQYNSDRINIFSDALKGSIIAHLLTQDASVESSSRPRPSNKPRVYSLMTPINERDENLIDEKLFTGLSSIHHRANDYSVSEHVCKQIHYRRINCQ